MARLVCSPSVQKPACRPMEPRPNPSLAFQASVGWQFTPQPATFRRSTNCSKTKHLQRVVVEDILDLGI